MADIVMPRLSDTMEEGTILRWLKRNGEDVARGEELVEIETDKATMIYESDQAGVLEILAAEGSTLAVGEVIAHVGAVSAAGMSSAAGTSSGDAATPADHAEAPALARPASVRTAGDTPPAGGSHPPSASSERVKATPLARRMASESGIDLRELTGSGPGGRIVKADVLAPSAGAASSVSEAASGVEGVITAKGQSTDVELSRTQQTVARRMAESRATIPDFTLTIDVDMEGCVELRAELKRLSHPAAPAPNEAPAAAQAPTYNDMVVKASALALREHPHANGSYRDGRVQIYSRVNVGVAVAAEGALVVPTVFDADEKSLGEIARETRTLAERVRSATITPPELGGATFTVSNLGMYGVRSFTAIINPPQAGILSVGALEQRVVVREGKVLARNTMTLTLACDHRLLYGAEAAQFLARIRELLEAPVTLTL